MQAPNHAKPPLPIKLELNVHSGSEVSGLETELPILPEDNPMVEPPMIRNMPQSTSANLRTQKFHIQIEITDQPPFASNVANKKVSEPFTGTIEDQSPQKIAVTSVNPLEEKNKQAESKEKKEEKFFFEIFSRKHGILGNFLRILLIPLFFPLLICRASNDTRRRYELCYNDCLECCADCYDDCSEKCCHLCCKAAYNRCCKLFRKGCKACLSLLCDDDDDDD